MGIPVLESFDDGGAALAGDPSDDTATQHAKAGTLGKSTASQRDACIVCTVSELTRTRVPAGDKFSGAGAPGVGNHDAHDDAPKRRPSWLAWCCPCVSRPSRAVQPATTGTPAIHRQRGRGRRASMIPYDLDVVLGSELGMQLFQHHVQCEFSSENLRFYQVSGSGGLVVRNPSLSSKPLKPRPPHTPCLSPALVPRVRWCLATWT